MKLGFIGSGSRGSYLIHQFRGLGAEIGIVYGHRNRGTFPDVVFTEDVSEVVNNSDAVVVATPTETHHDLALSVIGACIPLFLEKPMAASVEEAVRIERAAMDRGSIVMIAHSLCYGDSMSSMLQRDYLYGYARQTLPTLGVKQNPYWEVGVHTVAVMDLLGVVDYGYELVVNPNANHMRHIYLSDGKNGYIYEPVNFFRNECLHFLNCVKNNIEPLTDVTHGRRVIETLTARYGNLNSMVYF